MTTPSAIARALLLVWLNALGCDDGSGAAPVDAAIAVADAAADAGPADARDPYAAWPADPMTVFPWIFTPEEDLPPYAHVRWETETWAANAPEAGLYLRKLAFHYTTAPAEVLAHFAAAQADIPPLGEGIVLSFSGDVLWVGDNWSDFGTAVAPITAADLRVGNLETIVSPTRPVQHSGLPVRFNAPPEFLDGLPFDVLQLNNNHALDQDDEGLEANKALVIERGFLTTGVDTHALEVVGSETVALLSYTWGVNRRDITSPHELFIIPFGHVGEDIDLSPIGRDVAQARADGATRVVLLLHWGFEFEHYPDPHFLQLARRMVEMGADVVVGEGPHVVQPAEICFVNHPERVPAVGTCSVRTADGVPRTAAVLYSVGNFSNDVPDRIEVETGIVAKVSLGTGGVTGLGWTPIVLRQGPPRVEPVADHLDDEEVTGESARLDTHLGAGWRR